MSPEDIFASNDQAPAPGVSHSPSPVAPSAVSPTSTDDLIQFDQGKNKNLSQTFLWIAAAVSILGTAYLWFANSSVAQALAEKTKERTDAVSEITSPTYVGVETKSTAFKSSVDQLKKVESDQYLMGVFLPKFYSKVNKNVTIGNLSLGADGSLAFDATTNSYKSAAAEMATLADWSVGTSKVLSGLKLVTISEDVTNGVVVKFSVSAKVDKSLDLNTSTTTSTSTITEGN